MKNEPFCSKSELTVFSFYCYFKTSVATATTTAAAAATPTTTKSAAKAFNFDSRQSISFGFSCSEICSKKAKFGLKAHQNDSSFLRQTASVTDFSEVTLEQFCFLLLLFIFFFSSSFFPLLS